MSYFLTMEINNEKKILDILTLKDVKICTPVCMSVCITMIYVTDLHSSEDLLLGKKKLEQPEINVCKTNLLNVT